MHAKRLTAHPSVVLALRVASSEAGGMDSPAQVRQAYRVQDALWRVLPPGSPDYIHPVLLARLPPEVQAKRPPEDVLPAGATCSALFAADDLAWLRAALERFAKAQPAHFAPLFADAFDAMDRVEDVTVTEAKAP